METSSVDRNRVFARMELVRSRRWARLRTIPVGLGIAAFVAVVVLGEIGPGEGNEAYFYIGTLVFVAVMGGSAIVALLTGNHIVVANNWGMVIIREYFNQARIFYLDWKDVKTVSPLRRGGLRFQRGMLATDLPGGLAEMAPDGTLLPAERSHPLLPLVLRFCPGVRVHEKLVEPLREQNPQLFHELASPQRKQGRYYLSAPSHKYGDAPRPPRRPSGKARD